MTNRPFISHNTNIFNEKFYSSVPSRIGSETVIITQSGNRTVYDQKTTSISKHFPRVKQQTYNTNYINRNPYNPYSQRNVMPGVKEFFPGGLSFSFNPVGQHFVNQPPNFMYTPGNHSILQPLTLEQQIALNPLEKNCLELMIMQEKSKKNPFKLKFNYNERTSTTDLPNAAQQILKSNDPCSSQSVTNQKPQTSPDENQCGNRNIENKKSEHKPKSNKKRKNKKKGKKKQTECLEEDDYSDSDSSVSD